MDFKKITEENSNHNNLENKSTIEILNNINYEDQKVAVAVKAEIESIQSLVDDVAERMKNGGRLFYIGAGTSGRLGILDASECPPTFGVADDLVNGIIAGGDSAIRKAVEYAEDDIYKGWEDLKSYNINENDSVIGIAASGTTPYVIGTLDICNKNHILTGGITCNPGSPLDNIAKHAIVPIVGPEFITGSTRMKSGTAQKLILNMISSSSMIKMGHIKGNKMIDMQLSNEKLIKRGTYMIMESLNISKLKASILLKKYKSVRESIKMYKNEK